MENLIFDDLEACGLARIRIEPDHGYGVDNTWGVYGIVGEYLTPCGWARGPSVWGVIEQEYDDCLSDIRRETARAYEKHTRSQCRYCYGTDSNTEVNHE